MSAQPIPFLVSSPHAVRVDLTVIDPEVVAELERRPEGNERNEFALHALRIGVLSLRHAAGAVDVDSIRRAGEQIVTSVREVFLEHANRVNDDLGRVVADYFDPKSGSLPQRIEQLVKGDGDLERALARHLDGDRSTLHKTLEGLVGPQSSLHKLLSPEQAGGVVVSMKSAVDELLKKQRDEVLRQFSLDAKDSALSRLLSEVATANGKLRGELAQDVDKVVREFSLDNDQGALARLVGRVEKAQKTVVEQLSLDHAGSALQRMSTMIEKTGKTIERSLTLDVDTSPLARLKRELVEITKGIEQSQSKFQAEMREVVATLQTRRAEAEKSPKHGHTFEDAMEEFLAIEARRAGDLYDRVGKRPGPSGSKKGDHLIALGPESAAPGARIVIESKAQKNYTELGAIEELADARENREAQLGIFVFKRSSAPAGIDGFRRVGDDILAVWDPEDPATDVYLRAALSVARALVVREHSADAQSEANLRAIERAVREIEGQVKSLDAILKAARVVEQKGSAIQDSAGTMREALVEQIEALYANLGALRESGEG